MIAASAALVASGLIVPVANADESVSEKASAAHGHTLWVDGLGLDVAGAGSTDTEWTPAGPNDAARSPLNLELLGGIDLGIDGLDLPIVKENADDPGLLWLGSAGVLESYASSPAETEAVAASGVLGSDGALDLSRLDDQPGENAKIDLTSLLSQLNLDGLTDQVLDEASLELGALGARAATEDGNVTTEYGVSDLKLNLHSQALDGVTGLVDSTVGDVSDGLNGLLGTEGTLTSTVEGLVNALDALSITGVGGLSASLEDLGIDTSSLLTSVQDELLTTPINNESAEGADDASVNIDLSTGTIQVDLAQLLIGPGGPYEGQSLNSLPANTDLLTDDVVNSIVSGITSALTGDGPNALVTKVVNIVKDGVYSLSVGLNLNLGVTLLGGSLTNTTVALLGDDGEPATIGGLLNIDGYSPADLVIEDTGILGLLLNPVLDLLTGALSDITGLVGGVVDPLLNGLTPALNTLLDPLVSDLLGGDNPLLKQVLDGVVNVRVNEQPDTGDGGAGSTTVRALGLTVLPILGDNAVKVELGSATVKAADEETPDMNVNANASASASASADADGNNDAAAEAAARASAYADNSTTADAASSADATSAASSAALADASSNASADANGSAEAAAVGSTDSTADSAQDASGTTAGDNDAGAASEAAAMSDASSQASANASAASDSGATSTSSSSSDPDSTSTSSSSSDPDSTSTSSSSSDPDSTSTSSSSSDPDSTSTSSSSSDPDSTSTSSSSSDPDSTSTSSSSSDPDSTSSSTSTSTSSSNTNTNGNADSDGEDPGPYPECLTPREEAVFPDVPVGHKFYKEIDWFHCVGHTTGIRDHENNQTIYGPQRRLSREAMAAFMYRLDGDPEYVAPAEPFYEDVLPGHKFYKEIQWMYDMGLSTGIKNPDGGKVLYKPLDRLSREAMAAFIYRLEAPTGYYPPVESKFLDMTYGDPFYAEINWFLEEGLTTGVKVDGGIEYWPKVRLSREAMAAFIYRLHFDYRDN